MTTLVERTDWGWNPMPTRYPPKRPLSRPWTVGIGAPKEFSKFDRNPKQAEVVTLTAPPPIEPAAALIPEREAAYIAARLAADSRRHFVFLFRLTDAGLSGGARGLRSLAKFGEQVEVSVVADLLTRALATALDEIKSSGVVAVELFNRLGEFSDQRVRNLIEKRFGVPLAKEDVAVLAVIFSNWVGQDRQFPLRHLGVVRQNRGGGLDFVSRPT